MTWLWLAIGLGAGFAGGVVLTWAWFELRLMKSPALLAPFGNIPSTGAPIFAAGYQFGPDLDANGNYVRHEQPEIDAEFIEGHWVPQSGPVTEPAVPLNLQIPETSDVKYPGTGPAAARDLAPFTVLDTTIALPPQKAWGALPYEDLPGMFVDQFLVRYFYTIIAAESGVVFGWRAKGVTPWQAFVQSNPWAKDLPELFWRLTSYHLSDRQLNEAIEMYTERISKPVGVKRDG